MKVQSEALAQVQTDRITPLAFPLWAERIASQTIRMESATERIERLARQLERAAESGSGVGETTAMAS